MPGNTIKIHNSKDMEWLVEDSKIPNLMKWLNKWGVKQETKKDRITQFTNWERCYGV